jgi:hypothetical protein
MEAKEDFFSPNHDRLLNIAWWAKQVAWIVLVAYILWVGVQILTLILAKDSGNFAGPTSQSLATMLRDDPLEALKRVTNMGTLLLRGIVYYLVLKGTSLGINMIVETDINYRDQDQEGVAQ